MENQYPARRFAPLSKGKGHDVVDGSMVLKGIVFDVDGTLCDLPEAEQKEAHKKIEDIESDAMRKQIPQAGLVTLMEHLDANDIKKGICTRNFNTPVEHLLTNHLPGHINTFAPIVTRDFRPPKPSPAGILHIAKQWGIISESDVADNGRPVAKRPLPLIMVGDSIDDIIAGHDAGAATVLLRSEGKEDLEKDPRTDLVISRLDELIDVLEKGFESRQR
ncbi:HAD-like protein [Aureobasidium pullulans]|nr:HAD-like protein [Aureobasidium pullulans]THY65713.1 HAD-like protein [Aureobasidium pullulans]THY75233.1 HAD-like protein [Aureobasidium pullulans]THZ48704.1 HAD-like protein [Aureobasidium pullulans]TIA55843.1 HAD-like protein [Aureobasidium pullulans]